MQQRRAGRAWRVGELAGATGLTVRTLHHWEELGLVTPSTRTAAGHRLYDERDVRRVYEVVALRELGLPLETIAQVLERGAGFDGVLQAHLSRVREQLVALRALETRLATLVEGVRRTDDLASSDLLKLIDEVSRMTETFRHYFDDDQLAQVQRRRERLGDDHLSRMREQWPPLIAGMQAEMDAGTPPGEPRVQDLARRWMELLETFDGGDPGIRENATRMLADQPDIQQHYGGPTVELIEYVKRVNDARRNR